MVNIIITSEMRVGSRWIHYLLRDLLDMRVSGELDVRELPHCQEIVRHRFFENRIVKFHHATQDEIFANIKGNYKVIGIVRNPRDRIVSWAFHQRFKPSGQGLQQIKDAKTDREAVRITLEHPLSEADNFRQLSLMELGKSTKTWKEGNYIWTSYHWLINDTFVEIKKIVEFLGLEISDNKIRNIINKNNFQNRSGRISGQEVRSNEWFRKGEEMDYLNWFCADMKAKTQQIWRAYWDKISEEDGKKYL